MTRVRAVAKLAREGKTVAAIARGMGLPASSVRNYLGRARSRGLIPYHRFGVDLVAEIAHEVLTRRGPLHPTELKREVRNIWGFFTERQFYRAMVLAFEAGVIARSRPQGCNSLYFCSSKAAVRKLTDARKSRRARSSRRGLLLKSKRRA